jgi:UMF1 family MFS transporter
MLMRKEFRTKLSWAFYDWANSAFTTTIMSGFFPIFFKQYWANPDDPARSTFYLGTANSLAAIVVALMAPFLGAVADRGGVKKKLLATFAFLGIMMTSGLWLVQQGFWKYAILFYVSATVGWSGANIFYDSLLPNVALKKELDVVSSLGYALGYFGGGLLFLLNVVIFLKYDSLGIPNVATAIKINFLSVAIWWAIFSVPIFLYVKEPKIDNAVGFTKARPLGWKQLIHTLRDMKYFKIVATFLLAYWLYIDGVDTIVRMAVDYGKSLNFTDNTLISALLMVQFIAFPAALAYGWIASKIGAKTAILTGIAGYILITFFGFFSRSGRSLPGWNSGIEQKPLYENHSSR